MDLKRLAKEVSKQHGPLPKPLAVVDTNIFLDLYSWHDWHEQFDSRTPAVVLRPDLTDAKSVWRKARAREALLLAMYLTKIKATTLGLSEGLEQLRTRPFLNTTASQRSWNDAFVRTYNWYVKEQIFRNWTESMKISDAVGSAADDEMLAYAKDHSLPLISSEGYTPDGIDDRNRMRKKARKAGVNLVRAADFYAGKVDEQEESRIFLQRFKSGARGYVNAYRKKHGKSAAIELFMNQMGDYYNFLLGDEPVRLRHFWTLDRQALPTPVSPVLAATTRNRHDEPAALRPSVAKAVTLWVIQDLNLKPMD